MATAPAQIANTFPNNGLTLDQMSDSPFMQLEEWVREAVDSDTRYPTAMTLATLGTDGKMDQRTVLLRHCDAKGLVFFTDDASKKIRDLKIFPSVSVHFFWHALDRQVRVSGRAEKIRATETTHYFVTPPDFAKQSFEKSAGGESLGSSRQFLIQQFDTMRSKFYSGSNQRRWSGYRIVPDQFEFWQGGGPRLRDRFLYLAAERSRWTIERLE